MARLARGEYLCPNTIQVVHVTSRCVRRAFLCGKDPFSGTSYEHRRQWIRDRLEFLASVFAIDCFTFSIMSNHLHLILRSRPDIVQSWSDEQVARRWLRLCPIRRTQAGQPAEARDSELALILNDSPRIAEIRNRLSDISWWMRMTSEKIAKQANREDACTGRFWEGRYRAQLLLDESAVLACAMYVDLNPIRAAMAQSLETSEFTGAKERAEDLSPIGSIIKQESGPSNPREKSGCDVSSVANPTCHRERCPRQKRSGWMSPLEIHPNKDPLGADPSHCGRRASLKGFLSVSTTRYLELLDWTGRQIRNDKRGAISARHAPVLRRLGIEPIAISELVSSFGILFKRAAGSSKSIAAETQRRGQNWMQAPGASLLN